MFKVEGKGVENSKRNVEALIFFVVLTAVHFGIMVVTSHCLQEKVNMSSG